MRYSRGVRVIFLIFHHILGPLGPLVCSDIILLMSYVCVVPSSVSGPGLSISSAHAAPARGPSSRGH